MMGDLFFNWLAQFLQWHPKLIEKIVSYGADKPYHHLVHRDGVPYMNRWWLMPHWMLGRDENGYLFPKDWVPVKIRLHHIVTEDYDRDLHDHPADYRTIILRGAYVEEDIFGYRHALLSGDTKVARAEHFHRISWVTQSGVLTIFMMWKKRNRWGFLKDGHKIHWREYFATDASSVTTTQAVSGANNHGKQR